MTLSLSNEQQRQQPEDGEGRSLGPESHEGCEAAVVEVLVACEHWRVWEAVVEAVEAHRNAVGVVHLFADHLVSERVSCVVKPGYSSVEVVGVSSTCVQG
jgi:hypothetical protein